MKYIWEGLDVKSGVVVKDRAGAECVIVETDDRHERRWSLYRMADHFVKTPMSIERLISLLNEDQFGPVR